MEKRSFISGFQIVMILFVSRMLFSGSYQAILEAGNSIQDLLISAIVGFIINFIAAIPILYLLKKHNGHDLIECGIKLSGKGIGIVIAFLYFMFFIFNAAVNTENFENYFTSAVIPDVKAYLSGILLIIVCMYGAEKGIESIARFGSIVAVIYILTFLLVFAMNLPRADIYQIKPLLYNGPKLMIRGVFMNYNISIQIVALALLAAFIQPGKSLSKTFAYWNVLSALAFFLLEFLIVTVTGAYGAKNLYPVHLLASISQFSVFERLDAFDMISWILNVIVAVTLYIYLAVHCLLKTGLNKHRRLLVFISGTAVFVISMVTSAGFTFLQKVMVSGILSLINTVFIVIIPLALIIVDAVKGKVLESENK